MSTVTLGGASPQVDLRGISGVEEISQVNGDLSLHTRDPLGTLHAVVEFQQTGRLSYHTLRLEEPTLEDVFLTMTGRRLRE